MIIYIVNYHEFFCNKTATSKKIVTSTESALSECKVSMSALEGMNKLLYEISSISKSMENIEDK